METYFEFDKWRGLSKKELKRELVIAQLKNDTNDIYLLMYLLDKYKSNKTDSYSVNRKKYQRILCPICNSSSHKIKGSVTEMRICKCGHQFTYSDDNKNAIYKVL
jgi:transposase-like protein